jgi:phosphoglycerol transferase MdoB-like AlkP superfamily enzyme
MLYRRLLPFAFIFLFINFCLRISLYGRSLLEISFSSQELIHIFIKGLWFDTVTGFLCLIPFTLYHLCLPKKWQGSVFDHRMDSFFRFIFCFILLFDTVAEHLFWTEFSSRFNFIAVDYLIYTQEVIGNIKESYPVHWLLLAVAVVAYGLSSISRWFLPFASTKLIPFGRRFLETLLFSGVTASVFMASNIEQSFIKTNIQATELSSNGIYSLFHAFWHNEINYEKFYAIQEDQKVRHNIHALLKEQNASFMNDENGDDIARKIQNIGTELHKNVIIVGMESLSADYMETFGNKENLTPYLDRFAQEGLFFSNTYATGTRTVRGLEALSLSVPPTPGQSILRRPNNEDLSSIGFAFQERGYDTKFIYGGYGYFDNMNEFFSHNGFDILDRNYIKNEEIHFENAWGVCDEDMFTRTIAEADKAYAQRKPFMYLVMTTSNHRPFTYPEGRIDRESKSGRLGGVKYADFSVGKLVKDSQEKPWFKDTIFVFVSDHTAGAGGKAELDPHKYHIPMIFYAPEFLKPQKVDSLVSQIDMAPTLFGLMNWSYNSKFYGQDALKASYSPRSFISNYQKIALVKDNTLTVLAPKRQIEQYTWPEMIIQEDKKQSVIDDAIAYYQTASKWKDLQKKISTLVKQEETLSPQQSQGLHP